VLVERLLASGHQVTVLSRRPPQEPWAARVTIHAGEITDSVKVASAVADADVVFHLAALLHIAQPTPQLRSEYDRINVEGTRTIVAAAASAAVRHFIFFSTIAVYGPTDGEVVDERTGARPDTWYGETKLVAERIVLEASERRGLAGSVLRMAAVYGPRVKANYSRLVRALDRGRFVPIGSGRNRRTVVFETDAADAAIAAVHPDAAGRIFNVSDGQFHQMRDIEGAICAALGRRLPRLRLPAVPVRVAASVVDAAVRVAGSRRAIGPAIDTYLTDVAVDATLIRRTLGWSPEVNLNDGWARAVADMRKGGAL
jgi:UDP-glucose 4-epimerase